jgi:hypothetical protein
MAPAEPETEQAPVKRPRRSHHKPPDQAAPAPERPKRSRKAPDKPAPKPVHAHARPTKAEAEAFDRWEHARRETDRLRGVLAEAAAVADGYFERTGRLTYEDRVLRNRTGGTLVLDQGKVREHLGARLHEFQTRTKLGWTLKLLGEPDRFGE